MQNIWNKAKNAVQYVFSTSRYNVWCCLVASQTVVSELWLGFYCYKIAILAAVSSNPQNDSVFSEGKQKSSRKASHIP